MIKTIIKFKRINQRKLKTKKTSGPCVDIYQTMFNEYNLKLLIKSLPVVPTEDAQQQHRNDEFERIQKIFNKLTNNKYV